MCVIVIIVISKSPTLVSCVSGKRGVTVTAKLCIFFLKLQNFLRINFCKVPCFERRLHIVCENLARLTINFFRRFSVAVSRPFVGYFQLQFGQFCCKNTFYLKNLFINSIFLFVFCIFAEHSQ